jgi:hypothetical protein
MLSLFSRVKTPVIYTRATIPPPLPLNRRDAYQERRVLPGPVAAPEIWYQLPPTSIKGISSQQLESKAEYTLFLANPVGYRGIYPLALWH